VDSLSTARTSDQSAHVLHVRCAPGTDSDRYRSLLSLLHGMSPALQALPPRAALVDVSGAFRYWGATPADLAYRVRTRALSHLDLDVRVGAAPNWTVAATASRAAEPVTVVPAGAVGRFLEPLPVAALEGVSRSQAARLAHFGVKTIGGLAGLPEATVQRILGGQAGRLVRDRARGVDPRTVTPTDLPDVLSERRAFPADVLDPGTVRAALLDASVALGLRLRRRRQITHSLALGVALVDGSTLTRTRRLREPTAHTEDLRTGAFQVFEALGLQRARIRGVTLTAERLAPAGSAGGQISLDRSRESRLHAEHVVDALNRRFGAGTVGPATLARRTHP
jgi:DNA polymerase-4